MIQTTIDQKAMTALARMTRKTVRRGRNGPVRLMAWFVVLLEAYLTVIYVRAGLGGWQMNLLLGGIMLACILGEDWVNGAIGLRRTAPEELEVNAAFQDDRCYVCRSQGGERWWLYSQIWVEYAYSGWWWRPGTILPCFWTGNTARFTTRRALPGAPRRNFGR